MVAAQALALERFLEGRGFSKKSGELLSGLGARLTRASELPARHIPGEDGSLIALLTRRGGFVELAARRSSGRFSIALCALAAATSAGLAAALVDLGDHLDPQGAQAAGVDLERLLWVRPRRAKQAVTAAEMLLCAGFPLVVVDFGLSPRGARYLPDAAWVRLSRAAQSRGAAILLATPWRLTGVAARSAVTASCPRPFWQGGGRSPLLLTGLSSKLTLEKDPHARTGLTEPLSLSLAEAVDRTLPLPARGARGGSPRLMESPAEAEGLHSRSERPGRGKGAQPMLLRDSRDPWKAVKPRIEAHDPGDTLALHNGQVQRVPGGQTRVAQHDSLGPLDVGKLHSENFIDDTQERIEGGLNRVAPVDGNVTVENLLEHLDVCDEALRVREQLFQSQLRIPLVGMLRPHQVHRDVRVEEDHCDGASR